MTISLGRLSAFPCFSVINELIGNQNGVVGGYVTVFKDEVEGAVNRVVSILKGTPPSDFPQIEGSNKAYVFDYGVLERWALIVVNCRKELLLRICRLSFNINIIYGLPALFWW